MCVYNNVISVCAIDVDLCSAVYRFTSVPDRVCVCVCVCVCAHRRVCVYECSSVCAISVDL